MCGLFSSSLKGNCSILIISVALMLLYPSCCVGTRTAHSSQDVHVPRYHILENYSLRLVFNTFLGNVQNLTGSFWLLLLHIQTMSVRHCRLKPVSGVLASNYRFSINFILKVLIVMFKNACPLFDINMTVKEKKSYSTSMIQCLPFVPFYLLMLVWRQLEKVRKLLCFTQVKILLLTAQDFYWCRGNR